ncbi:hypothetical protein LPJ64_000573 [Coemansia asiatica]|uniref:Uncharacterized protein n=1 Tax=Coemansia asiatica TaxID=1052880 RepID=A0A9W7XMU4_9FUNG|nr:hypothetical protein LPJ64_000573 [Coemansia asiatica]
MPFRTNNYSTATQLTTTNKDTGNDNDIDIAKQWRGDIVGSRSLLWDRIDSRQATLLDQTIRPYLPKSYPQLPRDPRVGDIAEGTAISPAAHLVYFPSPVHEFGLSPDGYIKEEAPPEPFCQRVWAGGVMEFNTVNPLRVGDVASQTKCIEDVTIKERSGDDPLVLVNLAFQTSNHRGICVTEFRDMAYMKPVHLKRRIVKHNRQPDFLHRLNPSEILLFRYSALKWNSHRIHYDSVYAREVERHPGLLVHGPLTCTLLLQLMQANMPDGMALRSFNYRAISPMYCGQDLQLNGRWMQTMFRDSNANGSKQLIEGSRQCELWATNNEGGISMKGVATLVPLAWCRSTKSYNCMATF